MKIESIRINNFLCFGPEGTTIEWENCTTAFVGGNGSGKTAAFEALSRLFGISTADRRVRKQDFHLSPSTLELVSGSSLWIEVIFKFPELDGIEEDKAGNAVPEFFTQMSASAPEQALKARMRLQATWIEDGTPEGSVDESLRWITSLNEDFEWDECKPVLSVERSSIQFIYIPAARHPTTQVTALLKGRLWQAARWSDDFRDSTAKSSAAIQTQFEQENPAKFIITRLNKHWQQVHEADTEMIPILHLVESRFEEFIRKAEFAFTAEGAGRRRGVEELSDGQGSLFHIALTAATLEVEKEVLELTSEATPFNHEKLRRTSLTVLAIEEPENSLSPFFLSRIVSLARGLGNLPSAQVALSSHSPSILSRIEPEEVRYFRFNNGSGTAYVKRLELPSDEQEARQYIRLAIRAYPELYFARFVILGEGDSERILIPRIAAEMGVQLDPSFVPIVPLGGRYVGHFWRLLRNLEIPHATLLDLDLGRAHGGKDRIVEMVQRLKEHHDLNNNTVVMGGAIDPNNLDSLKDLDLLNKDHDWLRALKEERIFFSFPLDIDFAMLSAFPEAYQHPNPGGLGPRIDAAAINEKKAVTLKTGGSPDLYNEDYDEVFKWYPYLFLNRSKPETHIAAQTRMAGDRLAQGAPDELKALIEYVKQSLRLQDSLE